MGVRQKRPKTLTLANLVRVEPEIELRIVGQLTIDKCGVVHQGGLVLLLNSLRPGQEGAHLRQSQPIGWLLGVGGGRPRLEEHLLPLCGLCRWVHCLQFLEQF